VAILGLFGKKQQPVMPAAPPPSSQGFDLPDIPPLEDMDLPPPPAYPHPVPAPKPEIMAAPMPDFTQAAPSSDMFVSDRSFSEPTLSPMPDMQRTSAPEPMRLSAAPERPEVFDRAVERRQIIPKRETKGPFYVKVDDYRAILESTTRIRDDIKDASDLVMRMNELKNEEDKEFEKWRQQLEDIQRKLTYVDKIIFESS
jgi:hypothetical protein